MKYILLSIAAIAFIYACRLYYTEVYLYVKNEQKEGASKKDIDKIFFDCEPLNK